MTLKIPYQKGNRCLGEFGFENPVQSGGEIEMKAKVEKTIKIDDGKHEGEITAINYKDEPYNYVDVVIKEKEQEIEMKCGVPFSVTENTSLGKMLVAFGAQPQDMEIDKEIEIEDFLKVGTKVEFQTITETTKKGTFARIVSNSLKPKK